MNSEITKIGDNSWLRGWVLYDGDCVLCCRSIKRFDSILTRRGFDLAPLQSAWVCECLNVPQGQLLDSMRVLTPDGRHFVGADALIFLAKHIWWAWPVYLVSLLPGARPILRRAYRWLAAHRHCTTRGCNYVAPIKTTSDPDHRVV